MGMNTVVVLYNDMTQKWPEELVSAMRQHGYPRDNSGWFGWGHVVSIAHADWKQLVYTTYRGGEALNIHTKDIPNEILIRMADILQNNGYKVTKRRTKV